MSEDANPRAPSPDERLQALQRRYQSTRAAMARAGELDAVVDEALGRPRPPETLRWSEADGALFSGILESKPAGLVFKPEDIEQIAKAMGQGPASVEASWVIRAAEIVSAGSAFDRALRQFGEAAAAGQYDRVSDHLMQELCSAEARIVNEAIFTPPASLAGFRTKIAIAGDYFGADCEPDDLVNDGWDAPPEANAAVCLLAADLAAIAEPERANDEEADAATAAAIAFRPFEHSPNEWRPPSEAAWSDLGRDQLPTLRTAWLMMFKTKAEVIRAVRVIGDEPGEELLRAIGSFADDLENMCAILRTAEARMLVGMAAAAVEEVDAAI